MHLKQRVVPIIIVRFIIFFVRIKLISFKPIFMAFFHNFSELKAIGIKESFIEVKRER